MSLWKSTFDAKNCKSSDEIITSILKNRGIQNIDSFLHPTRDNLIPFENMEGIQDAASEVLAVIHKKGSFLIYADVDTDGCTSTAIIYRYLKNFGECKTDIHINEGKEHGIPDSFTEYKNYDAVIVVDSINDTPDKYLEIVNSGVKLIILDHHVPTQEVLDNRGKYHLVSSAVNYSNPNLSGAGVTWKFCAFLDKCISAHFSDKLMDLAATGIIADMCDVSEKSMENRYICYEGLRNLRNPAIQAIVGNYDFNANTISWSIAPLINSANRLNKNKQAVEFFIEDDVFKISHILEQLKSSKEEQKERVAKLYEDYVVKQIPNQLNRKCLYFCVTNKEEGKNFNGLLANKVSAEYCRPVMVFSPDENNYAGSMRGYGIDNFSDVIKEAGAQCYGHENAAGVIVEKDYMPQFWVKVEEALKDYTFEQKINIDATLSSEQVTVKLAEKIEEIDFVTGQGFPRLVFEIKPIKEYKLFAMAKKHLKITVGKTLAFIMWNFSDWNKTKDTSGEFTAVGNLEVSSYGSNVCPQMIMSDFKITSGNSR